jgi:endo-alpha-1,4-polygalactosaminidase (GH114 family)
MNNLYLLDANVFITANNLYYPIDRIPEYWKWILAKAKNGQVKVPHAILDEIVAGTNKGPLDIWIEENHNILLLEEDVNKESVDYVIINGYLGQGEEFFSDDEIEEVGKDPFLIAYCLHEPSNRIVVTTEVSKDSLKRSNRKIPDVCKKLKAICISPEKLLKLIEFRTSDWR